MNSDSLSQAHEVWERYICNGNSSDLFEFIQNHPELQQIPAGITYPQIHRITDIVINGCGYRVLRALLDHEEKLVFQETENPDIESLGVPYWLTGAKLNEWVQKEIANPSKEPVDWDAYR